MTKNFENLFDPSAFQDTLKLLSTPAFDVKSLSESQQKNIQAYNEVHQKLVEAAQNTGKLQMQIWSDLIENSANLLKEITTEGTPEDKLAKQTEINRKAYEKSMKNLKAMADLSCASSKEFSDLIQKRVAAALTEVQDSFEKTPKKKA
jgi:phasin family protein